MIIGRVWNRIKEILFMYVASTVFNREHLRVADGSRWGIGCLINAAGGVSIGKNVLIGPHVIIHSANHVYSDPDVPIKQQGHVMKSVIIEDDVWVGSNVVILPGVHLGKGVVIGAGSVVSHDIPAYCVAVGNPCHIIKMRGGAQSLRFTDWIKQTIEEERINT